MKRVLIAYFIMGLAAFIGYQMARTLPSDSPVPAITSGQGRPGDEEGWAAIPAEGSLKRSGAYQLTTGYAGPSTDACNGMDDDCDGWTDNVSGRSDKIATTFPWHADIAAAAKSTHSAAIGIGALGGDMVAEADGMMIDRGTDVIRGKASRDQEKSDKGGTKEHLSGMQADMVIQHKGFVSKSVSVGASSGSGVNEQRTLAAMPTQSRSWFPQTLLFTPIVETDNHGHASVDVKIPDALTDWRVLALAHSQEGTQAAALTHFRSSLPTYVDPIVPAQLRAGDEVNMPMMIVNTAGKASELPLRIDIEGGFVTKAPKSAKVQASGSEIAFVRVRTERPGTVTLHATLGSADSVVRTIPVKALGAPHTEHRSGTLAAEQTVTVEQAADAKQAGATAHLRVYPGAVALLRSELENAANRSYSPDGRAYALLLAGRATEIAQALNQKLDEEEVRRLSLRAAQLVIEASAGRMDAGGPLLIEAALSHPTDKVLHDLGQRGCSVLANQQLPDGTFAGSPSTKAQAMIVSTIDKVEAVRADQETAVAQTRARGATLRASSTILRWTSHIDDAYTAAVVLASGFAPDSVVERLRKKIRDNLITEKDKPFLHVKIPTGTVRADGIAPSQLDAAAFAILALDEKADAVARANLGALLLSSYAPSSGWGDGRTNIAALRAVAELFKDPLPESIAVKLAMDGQVVASGTVAACAGEPLVLDAPLDDVTGKHQWTITADPPLASLGFTLDVVAYGPWKNDESTSGLGVAETLPKGMSAGKLSKVSLVVSALLGHIATVRYSLPVGVRAVKASLEKLKTDGVVTDYFTDADSVSFTIPASEESRSTTIAFDVIPSLAGHLHAGATTVNVADSEKHSPWTAPTAVWEVM